MLIPRRVKHRKQHHPSRKGATKGGSQVAFGDYGIQALAPAYVTNRQIEAAISHNASFGSIAISTAPSATNI
jgi:large subunit ribosomal protein L16